jgi:hypothetical protein
VTAQVKAFNVYGWSLSYSPVNTNGATIKVVPSQMGTIFVNAFATTTTQVTVYWSALSPGAACGDATILSYDL